MATFTNAEKFVSSTSAAYSRSDNALDPVIIEDITTVGANQRGEVVIFDAQLSSVSGSEIVSFELVDNSNVTIHKFATNLVNNMDFTDPYVITMGSNTKLI